MGELVVFVFVTESIVFVWVVGVSRRFVFSNPIGPSASHHTPHPPFSCS